MRALLVAGPAVTSAAPAGVGIPWWVYAALALGLVVAVGAVALLFTARKGKAQEQACASCGKIMMSDWPRCMFCKTPRIVRPAAVEVVSGPMLGHTITLEAEVTTIGSAPGSTIVLADVGVSRKHAGIRRVDGGFELADLGSTNGVYVNGEKVPKRRLELGDVIRVGATEMVFRS